MSSPQAIDCRFITVEDDPPDLIVAFACAQELYDQDNDIMIHRVPAYEPLLPPEERGARVTLGYADDRGGMLEWIRIEDRTVELKAGPIHEIRDCSGVERDEWNSAIRLLRKMKRGGAFRLSE